MKTIESTRLGKIEYQDKDVITFNKGIPGFEREKEFIIYQPEKDNPISFLQSVTNKELMFVIVNPFSFYKDYSFDIDKSTLEELSLEKPEDVATFAILSIPENFEQATINLKAPLIINSIMKIAKQYILNDSNYETKTPLFPQVAAKGEK